MNTLYAIYLVLSGIWMILSAIVWLYTQKIIDLMLEKMADDTRSFVEMRLQLESISQQLEPICRKEAAYGASTDTAGGA